MSYTTRSTSTLVVPLDEQWDGGGYEARELADSIAQVGILRALVVDAHGAIIDGKRRARALRMLGASEAPAIRMDLPPADVTQAASIRTCCKGLGLAAPSFAGASRATLDRVEKVYSIAEDVALPLPVRIVAAEGIAQLAAGESANGILTRVTAALNDQRTTSRYPELTHLAPPDATRMADYLDSIEDPAARELELSVLRLTSGGSTPQDRTLSMSVYTHMQDLAHVVDAERANEVAAALAAAISGSSLTPALRDRCLEVADQLERTASGIRAAMTFEMEHV